MKLLEKNEIRIEVEFIFRMEITLLGVGSRAQKTCSISETV